MAPRVPLATYRVQLKADFGFDAAAAIVPYLKALGITHLYASPFLKARAGSAHGYDIVDHTQINPELGGDEGFERLSAALRAHDLGLILDFVPNHMGVHYADNPYWLDTLEWGPASPHAVMFDIDWDLLAHRARGGVLVPILGAPYGQVLERGEIELRFDADAGELSAWYYEHRLPIAPQRYGEILRSIVQTAGIAAQPAGQALLALAAQYGGLRRPTYAEAPAFKAALAAIDGIADIMQTGLAAYRAGPRSPDSTQTLHRLLERQHYRLGHWSLASSEINYRRFFDVNSLAGLRVEEPEVFATIHPVVRRLIAEDKLQGVRLDHIDGLRDPAQYCQRLQRLFRDARRGSRPYLLIEKIVGHGEALPKFSGVDGTTGYEWLNAISRVLVNESGLNDLDETWRQVSNIAPNFPPVLREAKQRVLETLLVSEFTVLWRLLSRIAAGHYTTRDFSADSLRQALELYILNFPVYRTYLTASEPSPADRVLIDTTIAKARRDWFGADDGIFDFLRDCLTMDLVRGTRGLHSRPRVRRFALKMQQFTGPMMAKSLEDTAFYRYHRLLALNEVGGEPAASALSLDDFHAQQRERAAQWPHGLTATATHDTKRGEDARTRILAIAEMPGEWSAAVSQWKMLNALHVVTDGVRRAPSAAAEYMLYQTLIGVWPPNGTDASLVERVQAFALKAAREAKLETSWLNPDPFYEDGLRTFIARILDPAASGEFLDKFATFARRTALIGALNSLSQLTLKATLPGVPDFYQGTEFWDLSMVDPDNRRPVDFAVRQAAMQMPLALDSESLAGNWTDGHIKLAWTRHLIALRAADPDLWTNGDYVPLEVTGPHREHVIAFARRHGTKAAIVAAGRWFAPFTDQGRRWFAPDRIDATVMIGGYRAGQSGDAGLPVRALWKDRPAAVVAADAVRQAG